MTVYYEDRDCIVCHKERGILSEPKAGSTEESMLSRLTSYFASQGEHITPYPVHRLDRPTGGVMVFAKNPKSAAALSASAAGGGMKKEYLAVVEGVPAQQAAKLHDLLFFDRQRDKTFVVDRMRRGVKEASLSYELVATRAPDESCPVALSLLRVRLESGRTHQIRAQFASRRLPLYGDARYGAKTRGELGLFAATLSFPHPKTRQALSFSATPPAALPFSLFGGEPIVQK